MAQLSKIDSNVTGLKIAEEQSYKVLPASPTWLPREPNSYSDFGGQITTIARNPINPDRQRKKGVTTDLEASAGWSEDLTQKNLQDIGQGYFFASLRRKGEAAFNSVPIISVNGVGEEYILSNLQATIVDSVVAGGTGYAVGDTITLAGGTFSTATVLTVTGETGGVIDTVSITTPGRYSVAPGDPVAQGSSSGGGTGATFNMTYDVAVTFVVGQLLHASGFTNSGNNGLKRVTAVTGSGVQVGVAEDLVSETPPAAANLVVVGVQATAGDLDVSLAGSLPAITSTTLDFTTLGLIPGEFIFVGGDTAATAFANAANNGFARIRSVAANTLTFDKTQSTMVTEASTTETVRLFFGRVLKNETGTLIVRRTYQQERTLGAPDDALPAEVQAEYITGCVPSELQVNIPSADKVTMDLSFVGADHETVDGPTALKTGTRPAVEEADAFNTSSDFSRIKMAQVVAGNPAPSALFAFVTDITLTLNNNVTPNKAIGVLGAFEVTAGTFEVGGNLTAYFANVAAVQAVRDNADVTLDIHMVKQNAGISVDIPLMSLGDARANVEQDAPITLPIEMAAASGAKIDSGLNHTMLLVFFDYLPSAADV